MADRYPSRPTSADQFDLNQPEPQHRRARTHPRSLSVSKSREFCSIPVSSRQPNEGWIEETNVIRPPLTPVSSQAKFPRRSAVSQKSSKTRLFVRSTVLSRSRAKASRPGSRVKLSSQNSSVSYRVPTIGQRSIQSRNRVSSNLKKFTLQSGSGGKSPPPFTPRTTELLNQNPKYNPCCTGCKTYRELMNRAVEIIASRDSTIETQRKELEFFIACNVELNNQIIQEYKTDKNSCSYCGGPIRKGLRSTSASSRKTTGVCTARRSASHIVQASSNKTVRIDDYEEGMSDPPSPSNADQNLSTKDSVASMKNYLQQKRLQRLEKIPEGLNSTIFEDSQDEEGQNAPRQRSNLPPPPSFQFPFEVNSRTNFEPGSSTSSEIKTEIVSLRIALAARESLLNELQNRIKKANRILNHRFATLTSVPDLAISASQFQDILTSHRKFVRWLNRYTIKGIEDIAKFEQLNIRGGMGGNSHVNYYVETRVPIRGVMMNGVFIPIPLNGGFASEKESSPIPRPTQEAQVQVDVESLEKEKPKILITKQVLKNEIKKEVPVTISPKAATAKLTSKIRDPEPSSTKPIKARNPRPPSVKPIPIVVKEKPIPQLKPIVQPADIPKADKLQPQNFSKEENVSPFVKMHTAMEDALVKDKAENVNKESRQTKDENENKTVPVILTPEEMEKPNDSCCCSRPTNSEVTSRRSFNSCAVTSTPQIPEEIEKPNDSPCSSSPTNSEMTPRRSLKTCGAVFPKDSDPPTETGETDMSDTEEIYRRTTGVPSYSSTIEVGSSCPAMANADTKGSNFGFPWTHLDKKTSSHSSRARMAVTAEDISQRMYNFKAQIEQFKNEAFKSVEYDSSEYTNESAEDNQDGFTTSNWASGATSVETLVEYKGQNSFSSQQETSKSNVQIKPLSEITESEEEDGHQQFSFSLDGNSSTRNPFLPIYCPLPTKKSSLIVSQSQPSKSTISQQVKVTRSDRDQTNEVKVGQRSVPKFQDEALEKLSQATELNEIVSSFGNILTPFMDSVQLETFGETEDLFKEEVETLRKQLSVTRIEQPVGCCECECMKQVKSPCNCPRPRSRIPKPTSNVCSPRGNQNKDDPTAVKPIPAPRKSLKNEGSSLPVPVPRCRASFDASNTPQGTPKSILARPRVNPNPINPNPQLTQSHYTTTYEKSYNRFGWKQDKAKEKGKK